MKTDPFKRICVYCGSSNDVEDKYLEAARSVGVALASAGATLVYGGGRVGLMGAVADGALSVSGEVYGVLPHRLSTKELAHDGLTELFLVDSMHARKTMMAALSDAFIALPGGWGTLEELFEVTTWTQLRYHEKPVGVLNVDGYYDQLLAFLDRAHDEGFIRGAQRGLLQADTSLDGLLERMRNMKLPNPGEPAPKM